MEKHIPKKALEVKMAADYLAIECHTLDTFLGALPTLRQTQVFLCPMVLSTPYGAQKKVHFLVHVTAYVSLREPTLYASFHAAEATTVWQDLTLITPCRQGGMEKAQQLQKEMATCLSELIAAHPSVSRVVEGARFRLPKDWVLEVASEEPRIQFQDGHWVIKER